MNIVIDSGNSLIKIAVFDQDKLLQLFKTKQVDISYLEELFYQYPRIEKGIISDVSNKTKIILEWLEQKCEVIVLTPSVKLPYDLKYTSKSTLGVDRLAAVAGGYTHFKNTNLLVINAGTCITFDFLDKDLNYFGGAISPGVSMRLKSLQQFTQDLPLVDLEDNVFLVGKSTKDAILSGVVNGIIYEIDGAINDYLRKYHSVKIVFSGGDAPFLFKRIKSEIFADFNLVSVGLNFLLNLNKP